MINSSIQHQTPLLPSELILNPDGSIYHLNLRPEDIADDIIVVGDQHRVKRISSFFDKIDVIKEKREFVTHTGWYKGKRITALSTGIGCDNIDIVINELDAIVNIDLETRIIKENPRKLNIIRLGTSGALQADIPVDSFVISSYGLGFDGLAQFYATNFEKDEIALQQAFIEQVQWKDELNQPYFAKANSELVERIEEGMIKGITATANGFYGPQGRSLRLTPNVPDLNERLNQFSFEGHRITNFEMETSALYALGGMLGHNTATVCAIIANRFTKTFSEDYKQTVDRLIQVLLDRLS
ncbi:MAG: nucleoside phosphorylase [Flavobacteriales bacterium]|jgi:uridine phosphorylase|nr:nucleoside phosphorylase [Flavobacteriales bacterium]